MLPAAPGLFSMMNCWPRLAVRRCATWRAATSGALPAMNGTMMRTSLSGYSARAPVAKNRIERTRNSTLPISTCHPCLAVKALLERLPALVFEQRPELAMVEHLVGHGGRVAGGPERAQE